MCGIRIAWLSAAHGQRHAPYSTQQRLPTSPHLLSLAMPARLWPASTRVSLLGSMVASTCENLGMQVPKMMLKIWNSFSWISAEIADGVDRLRKAGSQGAGHPGRLI